MAIVCSIRAFGQIQRIHDVLCKAKPCILEIIVYKPYKQTAHERRRERNCTSILVCFTLDPMDSRSRAAIVSPYLGPLLARAFRNARNKRSSAGLDYATYPLAYCTDSPDR